MQIVFQIARWLIQRIPAWLLRFRPFNIYEITLPSRVGETTPTKTRPDTVVQVAWATPSQLGQLKSLSPSSLLDNANGRSRAVVAWLAGEPIGITWLATDFFAEEELGLRFELGEDEAWMFASHVLATHRQQGVYATMLRFVFSELAGEGKRRLLLGTTRGNEPSRKAHEGMGARVVGALFAVRLFSFLTFANASGSVRRTSGPFVIGAKTYCEVSVD